MFPNCQDGWRLAHYHNLRCIRHQIHEQQAPAPDKRISVLSHSFKITFSLSLSLMASTTMHLLHVITLPKLLNTHQAHSLSHPKPTPLSATRNRRQCILLLTATTFAVKSLELPAKAEDIGLFGIRKRIQKAEEEVEEVVKEGIENAEKGFEKAEKGFENSEKGFEKVEKEVVTEAETGFGFGGLVQAGAVAGAEVVGVLVATSVVNGILGPEGQNS